MKEGNLTVEWSERRLKTVAELRTSNVDKNSSEDEQPVRLCNYTDVYYSSVIDDPSGFMKATATHDEIRRFRLRRGDVLITKDSETAEDIAVPAHVARDFDDVLCGYHLAILRPRQHIVGRYLYYALLTGRVKDQFSLGANGITRFGLSQSAIKDVRVPVPDVDTQHAIASFLDRETARIDTLIGKKRRLLDLLEEKRTALITRAVTRGLDPDVPVKDSGVEWIGEIPEHWEVVRLKHLAPPGRPITYGIVQAGPHEPDGVPYIRTSDMAGDALPATGYQRTSTSIDAQYARSRVHPGDVVVAIRATVGKSLIVPDALPHANLTQGTARVAAGPRVLPEFLQMGLSANHTQHRFTAVAKGATFREITLGMLRDVEFCVPPISEQNSILQFLGQRVGQYRALDASTKRAIDLLREYRTALISSAVTGRLDVRELVVA